MTVQCPDALHTDDYAFLATVGGTLPTNEALIRSANKKIQRVRRNSFKGLHRSLWSKLQLDHVGAFSVTESDMAMLQAQIISQFVWHSGRSPQNTVITDGTASIGGNVFAFAALFAQVNAVEIDSMRAHMLQHNVEVVGIAEKVHVWCGDICAQANARPGMTPHDVIFLDPPWGGGAYRTQGKLSLCLGHASLQQVCVDWSRESRLIALKLPLNFDFDDFFDEAQAAHALPFEQVFRGVLGYVKGSANVMYTDSIKHDHHPKMILLILRVLLVVDQPPPQLPAVLLQTTASAPSTDPEPSMWQRLSSAPPPFPTTPPECCGPRGSQPYISGLDAPCK